MTVVRPGNFKKVMRNIHLPTIGLYASLMLMVIANLSLETINSGANVLSLLAERVRSIIFQLSYGRDLMSFFQSAGRWMRIWVVIDASIVLSAGVLTGLRV